MTYLGERGKSKKWRKSLCVILAACLLFSFAFAGCGKKEPAASVSAESADTAESADASISWNDLTKTGEMPLKYADQFTVSYYDETAESADAKTEDTYVLIEIEQEGGFLLVPEDRPVPDDVPEDLIILQAPLSDIYVASSATMDFWRELDALSQVKMCSTKEDDWSIPEIREQMEEGAILYAGKYNEPDYEMLMDQDCDFIIENTMIYHSPDTLEKLEKLGFPVMVDRSSYESHPMGRLEWIRLYGLLCGKEDEAEEFFRQQDDSFLALSESEPTGRTVAFFYITSNGSVNVRKSGDYISKMIALSGGQYVFDDLEEEEENALSTVNMQMETFYNEAKDADILIYNTTVTEPLADMDELLGKSSLLSDFKAVQEGNVFCTTQDMYQQPTGICTTMEDFHAVIQDPSTVSDEDLHYLYRLR